MDEEEVREEEEEEEEDEDEEQPTQTWAEGQRGEGQSVFVETGRGQSVEVPANSPFASTVERLANEAHYGGWFRVFLNGAEVVNPEDSPETIEPGMRVAITSYDKVG